jgi:hypothetical protein
MIAFNRYIKCFLRLFLWIGIFTFSQSTFAEDAHRKIVDVLINNGYENVKIRRYSTILIVAYENRVNRFEVNAITDVINKIVPLIDDAKKLILIPLNRKIPIIKVSAQFTDCKDFCAHKISAAEFAQKITTDFNIDEEAKLINNEYEYNSSNTKFDLVIKPFLEVQFGPFDNPVIPLIGLAPDVRVGFWKGMRMSYEVIVPLYNESGPRNDSVHTGTSTINQFFRFPDNIFFSTSVGIFTNDRYGFDLEARKYFLNGDFSVGANYGLTSFISFSGFQRIFYYDKFIWTGSFDCDFRIQKYDLTLKAMVGRFLIGDISTRFDINREFGEIEIGFFAIMSFNGVSNGGFNISIPLWPSKYWNPGFVRLKTSENYNFSYIVKSNPLDLIGNRYNTGNRINSFIKKLNPGFIKNILSKENYNQRGEI